MTRTFRARFDGKVLIPEEPVDLPAGQVVELRFDTPAPAVSKDSCEHVRPLAQLADWIQSGSIPPAGEPPSDLARNYRHYLYGHPKVDQE